MTSSARSKAAPLAAALALFGCASAPQLPLDSSVAELTAVPFFPQSVSELSKVYDAIATELASQYSIGYVPRNVREDGKYRRVVVRVANKPELKPRTRTGYFLTVDTVASRSSSHQ